MGSQSWCSWSWSTIEVPFGFLPWPLRHLSLPFHDWGNFSNRSTWNLDMAYGVCLISMIVLGGQRLNAETSTNIWFRHLQHGDESALKVWALLLFNHKLFKNRVLGAAFQTVLEPLCMPFSIFPMGRKTMMCASPHLYYILQCHLYIQVCGVITTD